MNLFELDLSGLKELEEDISKVIKMYPDKADARLEKIGRNFKKSVKKITPDSGIAHKYKLKKGYQSSKAKGFGEETRVEITTKSPHFHLVENGHELVKRNKKIGWVEGVHMMEKTRKEYEQVIPTEAGEMIDELLKDNKL